VIFVTVVGLGNAYRHELLFIAVKLTREYHLALGVSKL
jgi:formamidopyrimidine-DNA glycosylase